MKNDIVFHEFDWHANCKFHVYIHPSKRIEIYSRNGAGEIVTAKVFHLDDEAEYDSYNLKYTGQIKSITTKNVIIQPRFGSRTKRLDFRAFAWRNYDFDPVKTANHNADVSNYI